MGTIFQLDDKGKNGSGFPAPADGSSKVYPLDYWATLYQTLSASGVTVFKYPPLTQGATLGAGFDPYDFFSLKSRFGSKELAQRNAAIGFRNGMEPMVHLVHHHCDGGANQKYPTKRFPRDKNCFWEWSEHQKTNPDPVPDPSFDGGIWAYGDEFRWLSGTYGDGQGLNGPGYVARNLIDSAKWQMRSLGARQVMIDDLKGTNANYIAWLCNTLWSEGLCDWVAGEFFQGDRNVLHGYINSYPINRACGCLDFSQRFADQGWCNSPGNYDMRQMLWNGLWWLDAAKTMGFLDDTDTVGSEPVWRVWQGNAALLTKPSYAAIFGLHCYPSEVGGFGLMDQIMNLAWFRAKFCNGPMRVAAVDVNYIIFEYTSWPGGIIALGNKAGNFNRPEDWLQIPIQTSYWGGTRLHNYSGLCNDVFVEPYGRAVVPIPPADDSGRAFTVLAPAGFDGPIHLGERSCRQSFECAEDLDNAITAAGTRVTHIWSDEGKPIHLESSERGVDCEVSDDAGRTIIARGNWNGQAASRGWHKITGYSTTGSSVNATIHAQYWGTHNLRTSEFGDPQ